MKHGRRLDILIGIFLAFVAFALVRATSLGHKTLLPADNLFRFQPWSSFRRRWA